MPKMTVRVILKSGVEFSIKCDKFTLTRNGFQQVTGYNIEGITENKPVYLDFEQVAAVVRVCADGFRRLIIRKEKDMATPYKECPHCGAHLDSGEKCECRAEEIETVHSQKCACGLTEQDVESGWECPLDNPNETVERCEDCAFAKETD